MEKKGAANEQLISTVVYLIILIVFSIGMFYYVQQLQGKASVWEDYYSKEIALVVNSLHEGDEIILDVHKATKIAKNNRVGFDKIFSFNMEKKEVCVKLSAGRESCYSYFNDIKYSNGMRYGVPGNVLIISAKHENNLEESKGANS